MSKRGNRKTEANGSGRGRGPCLVTLIAGQILANSERLIRDGGLGGGGVSPDPLLHPHGCPAISAVHYIDISVSKSTCIVTGILPELISGSY